MEDPVRGIAVPLTRQVIFGSVKFLAFERACDAIFGVWPILHDATWTSLAVSLVAGGFSGCLSSVVSQPADSVLTHVAQNNNNGGRLRDANKWSNKMGLVPYSVALEAVVYGQAASLPDIFCSTMSFVPSLGLVETISHKSTKLSSQQPDKACDSSVCHVDTPPLQNSWSSRVCVLPVPRWQVCVSVGSFRHCTLSLVSVA